MPHDVACALVAQQVAAWHERGHHLRAQIRANAPALLQRMRTHTRCSTSNAPACVCGRECTMRVCVCVRAHACLCESDWQCAHRLKHADTALAHNVALHGVIGLGPGLAVVIRLGNYNLKQTPLRIAAWTIPAQRVHEQAAVQRSQAGAHHDFEALSDIGHLRVDANFGGARHSEAEAGLALQPHESLLVDAPKAHAPGAGVERRPTGPHRG